MYLLREFLENSRAGILTFVYFFKEIRYLHRQDVPSHLEHSANICLLQEKIPVRKHKQ
jgi:hypothetical protein